MSSKEAKIFISYSQTDSDFALKLGKDLRSAGANIWIDQLDIETGERWDRAIQKSLQDCDSLIIILSPAAMDSDNVMDEVAFAFDEKKQILPVLYKDCSIHFRLRRLQRSDFTRNYESGLERLLNALNIQPPVERIEQPKPEEETRKQPAKVKEKTELRKKTTKTKPQQKRTSITAPPAKVSPGPASPKIKLRTTPITDLSVDAVKKMLAVKGFYHSLWNKNHQGFANQFKPVERQGESLIIDENSGLTWQRAGSSERLAPRQADTYIKQLNLDNHAGYSDWRLPTLEEAMSLMQLKVNPFGLHIDLIFDRRQKWVWTADKKSASRAWFVYFTNGDCDFNIFFNGRSVRAVR